MSGLLSEGQTFAHYVIEAPIGEGGMGAVYRAHDTKLRRKVALKVIHPDLAMPDAAARLVREARAAAALAHPNTIAIHDLGEIDGTVFLVMELISGVPLRAYVGDETVPVVQKLRWLVDMARGLGAAHKAGLVHRDVKPTNVMVSEDGVVKVLDFGLAKPVEASSFHSDVGLVAGTPRYMAPELFTGVRADARSDQYAFGITAYELLSGVHPGRPTGPVPAALDTLVPELGAGAARVIARTLARVADERFATMNDVATALEEQLFAVRESVKREATPATRREGAGAPADDALALAPTELPLSSGASSRGAAGAAATPPRPIGPTLHPAPSGGGATVRLVVVLAVATAAVGYGASRLFDASSAAVTVAPVPSAVTGDDAGLADDDALDAELAADAAVEAELFADAAPDALEEVDDGGVEASADADVDAAPAPAERKLQLDDFNDPWAKPPAVDPRR